MTRARGERWRVLWKVWERNRRVKTEEFQKSLDPTPLTHFSSSIYKPQYNRKGGVDEVGDDFSDFSLSSPATKIRRLDAELPPIVEEEEPLPLPNQERALVLFKPFVHSPSSFSLTLHSDLLSGIKNNQYPWSKQRDSDCDRLLGLESQEHEQERNNRELAVVPWVPSPSSRFSIVDDSLNTNAELMEADEMEGEGSMMMDVEQEDAAGNSITSASSTIHFPTIPNLHQQHQGFGAMTEGFQQHCLLPQLPQNTSTPITWTR
ncbi:hypothetical protein VNO77_00387 [Canavalia gladiata]|uniref:Uncharacterized protein n=1 Tax=Canavalia gladiata TaxID=3824 RepID=A0AAN9R596_CANGL